MKASTAVRETPLPRHGRVVDLSTLIVGSHVDEDPGVPRRLALADA
jgi:hypothetical protein